MRHVSCTERQAQGQAPAGIWALSALGDRGGAGHPALQGKRPAAR